MFLSQSFPMFILYEIPSFTPSHSHDLRPSFAPQDMLRHRRNLHCPNAIGAEVAAAFLVWEVPYMQETSIS